MTTGPLTELLSRRPALVLDGAMGTELQRRGVDTGLPLWSARALASNPEAVLRIHREYAAAGADILTATTFRTTPRTFRRAGASDRSDALTALAVALARKAADETLGRTVLVAGSIAPLEDCYRPDLVPSDGELQEEHGLQATRLARAGVDFILLETMGTVREAVAALGAARDTGNEVAVSFLCAADGRLLGGEPLEDAVRAVARLKPTILSLNCVPADQADAAIDSLTAAWPGPWAIYPNAGRPEDLATGVIMHAVSPGAYAVHARRWLSAGARIVGGCCGTTPDHIAAVRALIPHMRVLDGGTPSP
ncbi:MAG: calE2 [Bacteroidetes bacterium]|nr:calE2 [Bacteroidota bacterium]